jgi:hypothetical protein
MKTEVKFIIKSHPTAWSDQEIGFDMADGTNVALSIYRENCNLTLKGNTDLTEYFYAIWELLAWNDGYFYTPIEYRINDHEHDVNELIRMPYYITDEKWKSSALLIGRNNRAISEEAILKYMELRKKGRREKSMNQSMVSSYFYLLSKAYADVNIEHRIVLLMHICDGFAVAYLGGDTNNNSGNINVVLKRLDCGKKYKIGAKMLGISSSKAKDALGETRNELTHFVFKPASLGAFISDPETDTDNMVNLYAFYILDLALRVSLLETIGITVDGRMKEYLLDENLDWIRLERHLEEDCVIPRNVLRQMLQRLQSSQKE